MRSLLPGSWLNAIAGSTVRHPRFLVIVWNPNEVTINQVADASVARPAYDLTAFVESIEYSENIGFENGDDPSVPHATFNLKRNPGRGLNLRRGLIEDGVIVQVRQGDARVRMEDWIPIFTGTFRGRPGDDAGTRSDKSEGMKVTAYGREERFLNMMVTTKQFKLEPEADPPITEIDLGEMAVAIAQQHLGLGQNEILFGNIGVTTKHISNQIVETKALPAIYECVMPALKKPKFDSLGRMVLVDVNLNKSAARIYALDDILIKRKIAEPNDVEVNNSVVMKGLGHIKKKIVRHEQMLVDLEVVTGFFDADYDEDIYYSNDHTQRALDTRIRVKHKIIWSDADWTEIDEFHGELSIDTHYLKAARVIIFIIWLATALAVAVLDAVNVILASLGPELTEVVAILSAIQSVLKILELVTMAALLWAMQFVGRGRYQVWGKPFEHVYPEIMERAQLLGYLPEDIREIELRNDFVSTLPELKALAKEHLRRELVKDQLYTVELLDDPLLEVDDIIETAVGDRFYIVSVQKNLVPRGEAVMTLTCWKIQDGEILKVDAEMAAAGVEAEE
jgi:hypothetical protein